MPKRYPEYQEGGQVPTDIQRLIKRMMEAKTDRAEEVIPDMAYGGIVGLQGGGRVGDPHPNELARQLAAVMSTDDANLREAVAMATDRESQRQFEDELEDELKASMREDYANVRKARDRFNDALWRRSRELDLPFNPSEEIDFPFRRMTPPPRFFDPPPPGPEVPGVRPFTRILDLLEGREPGRRLDSDHRSSGSIAIPYPGVHRSSSSIAIPSRASGGIIGLQNGGPPWRKDSLGRERRYRTGEEELSGDAAEWLRNMEMDVLLGRRDRSEHPTIDFSTRRAKHRGTLERIRPRPGDPVGSDEMRYVPRSDGPTIEDLYISALDRDPQMHPDSVMKALLPPDLQEELFPYAKPVWEMRDEGRASGGIIGFQAGGSPYQQQMVQSYVSPEVAQPYANLVSQIGQVGARPYTPYGGQRLAATTGDQALARAAYGAYGRGAGPAGTQQAAGTMGQAGQMIGGAYQGMAGLQPQYAQMAGQFGQAAQGALGQAQQDAAALRGAAGQAQVRGDLAAAGMRQTGAAAQAQQQALGAGQAAQGAAAQAEQQRLGAGQAAAAQAGQQQMAGLGAGMGAAGQAALAAQQRFGAGQQALGAGAAGQAQAREAQAAALGRQAQQAGAAGQAQMAGLGTGAAGLGGDIRSQLVGTGQQAQQTGQVGAADIRQAGLESQQLGQQALQGIRGVGGRAEQAGGTAAERMRQLGGQAPELGKGADMSQYMSQYTQNVTDPQLRQLMEFQKQQAQELGSQAAMAGAGGGYRHGLKELQAQQEAAQQAADIIGKGQKEAFDSAVAREREDARRREQAQQTGLSAEQQAAQAQQTGIGAAQQAAAQGFGAAQQGQAARQAAAQAATQAQQQGLSAQLQAQTAGGSAAQQAMGQQLQAAQQGLAAGQQGRDAQMRALQTGIAAGQYGSDAQMRAQQQAAAMGQAGAGALQQALAGQGALTGQGIGMGMQGLAAQRAAAQAGAGLGAQGLAAQRAAATQGAQLGLQGQQQGFQAGQAGAQLGMSGLQQAGQLGQQGYGTMGRMLGQQQGAIGAQGQAFGQMGQMGAQMGALGGQQQRQAQMEQQLQMQRLQGMEQAGARTQQEQQRDYDIAYQDFQRQQQWPQQQIGWQLGAMRQLPYQNTQVVGDYGQTPSTASDVAGALGAYHDWQSDQTADPAADAAADAAAGDVAPAPTPNANVNVETTDSADTAYKGPGARGGGYISSSGILAPYHKKLIDGLYAGGRINY